MWVRRNDASGNNKTPKPNWFRGSALRLVQELNSCDGCCLNINDLAATTGTELNGTCLKSEQGVVATASDVDAWVEVRSALANNDFTGFNSLATKALNAEHFRV
jgi:hypothetical protein